MLQTIARKICAQERKRDTLRDLFRTIIQQLRTSQTRVGDLDISTDAVRG